MDDSNQHLFQGVPDRAEVCELVGLIILHSLKNHFPDSNVGIDKDERFAVLEKLSGPKLVSIKKYFLIVL